MKVVTIEHMTRPQIETYYKRSKIAKAYYSIESFIDVASLNNWLFNVDDIDGNIAIYKVDEVIP